VVQVLLCLCNLIASCITPLLVLDKIQNET